MWWSKNTTIKKNIGNAMKVVAENFPNLDRSKLDEINVNINESGEITIKIGSRSNAVAHTLFDDDGNMNESIPQKVKDILGEQISAKGLREQLAIAKGKKRTIEKNLKKMEELIKIKDDEIKEKKHDQIKEKEKDGLVLKKMEESIKEKDDIIKTKDGELKIK